MATIVSKPSTKAFRENFDRAFPPPSTPQPFAQFGLKIMQKQENKAQKSF